MASIPALLRGTSKEHENRWKMASSGDGSTRVPRFGDLPIRRFRGSDSTGFLLVNNERDMQLWVSSQDNPDSRYPNADPLLRCPVLHDRWLFQVDASQLFSRPICRASRGVWSYAWSRIHAGVRSRGHRVRLQKVCFSMHMEGKEGLSFHQKNWKPCPTCWTSWS